MLVCEFWEWSGGNVYKSFSSLSPIAIYLLCDFCIKDNIQNKLKDLQLQNNKKDYILENIFGEKRGDYIKEGLVDSESVE